MLTDFQFLPVGDSISTVSSINVGRVSPFHEYQGIVIEVDVDFSYPVFIIGMGIKGSIDNAHQHPGLVGMSDSGIGIKLDVIPACKP